MAKREDYTALLIHPSAVDWVHLPGGRLDRGVKQGTVARPAEAAPADGEEGPALLTLGERMTEALGRHPGRAMVALPSDKVLLRVIDLPPVDDDELSSMIPLQVEKFSPFPVDTMVASHEVLERSEEGLRVLLGAVQKAEVEAIAAAFDGVALKFARVDAAILGRYRTSLDAGLIESSGRHAALFIDADTTPEVLVFDDGKLVIARCLGMGALGGSPEAADELGGELGHLLMSLELEHGSAASCQVSVWCHDELGAALKERIGAPCVCPVDFSDIGDLPLPVMGIARRGTGSGLLDLTPPEWHAAEARRVFRKTLLTGVALTLVAWALLVGVGLGVIAYEGHRLARLKARHEALKPEAMAVRELRRRVVAIQRYADKTHSSLECLREVSALLPRGIELSSFSYRKGDSVRVSGEAATVNQIYDFKRKMDDSALFGESTLIGPRYDKRKRKQAFDIDIRLPGGEASS